MNLSELIKEANNGSAAAQKCLFDELADKMMMVCRRYLKSPEDAEEILLDGFYKFFKNLSTFNYQGDAALHGWLKKIMINECLMFLRKKSVFTMVTETAVEDIALEEQALNNLSAAEIFKLLLQLPVLLAILSYGYLVHRSGDFMTKHTSRVGAGRLSLFEGKTKIEPAIYFNDFFKGVTPSIRLLQQF